MITVRFADKKELVSEETLDSIHSLLSIAKEYIRRDLTEIMDVIRDDVTCFMEYPYVEKIYRDSYYTFFSKKYNPCNRDSLRISFFAPSIKEDNFFTTENLDDYFFGYISLRPTTYRIIGSSFLHPKIMKNHDFVCCLCRKTVLVNGLKLIVHGFPYCGQDNESITCAEVSILNIMDYFGHKYPEYSTILPSQIAKMLSKQTFERQLPSRGINMPNISYILKKLGFGVRVYSHKDDDFRESLFIYIESGIPVILLSEDHAVLAIGRKRSIEKHYKSKWYSISNEKDKSYTDFFSHLLVMNDNRPPYELMDYNDSANNGFKISSFIVPLYSKVNMDASELKKSFTATLQILNDLKINEIKYLEFIRPNENYIYRYFFTSSKSYKDYIARSKDLPYEFKMVLNKSMPKFIGVVEIINERNIKMEDDANKVDGIVVLDATESGVCNYLIFAANLEYLIINSIQIHDYKIFKFKDNIIFNMFKNNLKGEHTQWKDLRMISFQEL
jgi:hypothetical protein